MNNERLRILNMLEEGRITNSEALELLKAIGTFDKKNADYDNKTINDSLSSSIESVITDFNKNTISISEDLSKKFNGMDKKLQEVMNISLDQITSNMKSLEQNLKNIIDSIAQSLNSSTAGLSNRLKEETSSLTNLVEEKEGEEIGRLSRSMKDMQNNLNSIRFDPTSLGENLSGVFTNLVHNVNSSRVISELYKKRIDDSSSLNLNFEAIRGSLFLEGYEGDEIETEVYCRTPQENGGEAVLVIDENNKYSITPIDYDSVSIQLDIKIPKKIFKKIRISTSDGKIEVSDISCECLFCTASRGKLSLSNISCDIIEAGTSEGKVNLSGIKSKKIFVNTNNSPIIIESTFCRSSDIITSNGSINLELNDTVYGCNEYKLHTENAPINVEFNIPNDTGIFIDAFSENGDINIDSTFNISYKANDKEAGNSHIVGQNPDYERTENSISIIGKTKNSQIIFSGNQA